MIFKICLSLCVASLLLGVSLIFMCAMLLNSVEDYDELLNKVYRFIGNLIIIFILSGTSTVVCLIWR